MTKKKNFSSNSNITSQKKQGEMIPTFNDESPHPYITSNFNKIDRQFYELNKFYKSWNFHRGIYHNVYQIDVIRKYLQYYYELTQFDQFKSSLKGINTVDRANLSSAPSEDILFKSYRILNDTLWKIRLTNKFMQRLSQFQQHGAKKVLATIMFLAEGNLPGPNHKQAYFRVKPLNYSQSYDYTSFFSIRIAINKNIIFNVGVERIPFMDRNQKITRYQFKPYMNFIDIVNDNRMIHDIQQIMTQHYHKLVDDVARGPEVIDDLTPVVSKKYNNESYLFSLQKIGMNQECIVIRNDLSSEVMIKYQPTEFQPVYLSQVEANSLIFDSDMHRWLNADVKMRIERKKFNLFQQTVNKQMLKKYVDFESAKNLVDLLQKIPNFRIALTQQEKNVIGQNGNVMVIGRSGTGKTTCAVMRLFAIEMLFKIRVGLNKRKYEVLLKDTRFGADDLDMTLGLHSLFVTASPVLTNQIQRYYKKLTDQIKQELDKKKKKVEEKKRLQKLEQIQYEKQQREQQLVNQSVEIIEKEQIIKEQKQEQIIQQIPSIKKELSVEQISQIEEQQHITEHFEGIALEQKENQGEEEDDFDEQFEQFHQKINKFGSLNDLQEEDYPGFFTVRALIMMIDGTLKKPFFMRSSDNKIMGKQSKAAWHNEQKGTMMIENYFKKLQAEGEEQEVRQEQINEQKFVYSDEQELEHEYQRQIRLREQKNIQQFKGKIQGQRTRNQMSFEIDFDYFAVHFWPQIKKRYYTDKNISAHMIWTQIYSTIKGGAACHMYPGGHLNERTYLETCQNMFLTVDQKKQIFQSFCQYERWKTRMMAYDLIDVVNYINTQFRWSGYYGPSIHYLMIDEVQDLPHSIIYLLSRVAEQGVFFSGDTAQTIAKGVGFRFGDLKTMFDKKHFSHELKLQKPSVLQLTVNFRSHNNILQLANSVVSIIEVLFPKTIDRLKKQRSDLHGPKPMLLADADEELLFLVLCGEQFYKKQLQNQQGNLLKRPPLQFGCDQVIIVRDQQSKKRIPSILQHALCLTIYEAKGLQFNDVILFNFFTESKCEDKWGIFKFIDVIDEEVDKKYYESQMTKHMQQVKPTQNKTQQTKEVVQEFGQTDLLETIDNGQKVIIKKIKPSSNINVKDINDYGELCSELKLLYTAITRPRNTLIIYDENSSGRKIVQKYWQKIGVTETITKQVLQIVKDKKDTKRSEQAKIFQNLVTKTDNSEWKKQGLKMFKRNYFEQAMKCFERCGDKQLYAKAKANSLANQSTKTLIEVDAEKGYIKDKMYNYANISKPQLGAIKTKLKNNERMALKNFLAAGKIFLDLKMYKQAGQCYFSGKDYQQARNCFHLSGMHKQVGQSYFMMEKYKQASQYFDDAGDYVKTIECLDMINDWSGILNIINKYNVKIPEGQKQSLIRKYAALSLQELVQSIQFENQGQKEEQMKKQTIQPLVIHERESDQEQDQDDDEDEQEYQEQDSDPQVQAEKEYNKKMSAELSKKASEQLQSIGSPSRKQSALSEGNQLIKQQSNVSNVSNTSEIEQIKQPQQINKQEQKKEQEKKESTQNEAQKKADSSASVIDNSQDSFLKLNNPNDASHSVNSSWIQLNQPDIQSVKSIADPSDQWLRSAFSQIQNKSITDYSVIDENENITKNARLIKTKGNIFVQDHVMERIIEIVSIVNSNIEGYLLKLKGHQALITKKKEGVENVQISDFEEIDPEFVFKILDTLQSFKIYKLCVFVCNRYHMPSKLGRYIGSMMLRYAVTAQQNMTITPSLLAIGSHRKSVLEKGILSSIALHSILENINPVFLKIKVNQKNQDSSLGSYFVTSLILQGMYKKIIFIVNIEEALAVLYNYFQADIYKNIYMNNYLKEQDQQKFTFYPNTPTENHAIEFSIFMAEQFIFKKLYRVSGRDNNHPLISAYFSKQHSARALIFKQQFPEYFSYNKSLWKYIEKKEDLQQLIVKIQQFNQNIIHLLNDTKQFSEIEVYDIITFALILLNSSELGQIYLSLSYNQAATLHSNFKKLHRFISTLQSENKNNKLRILKAFLSVYQARILNPKAKTMSIFGDSFIFIHRSSSIISDLVQYRRRKLIEFQDKVSKMGGFDLKFHQQIFFCQQNLDVLIAPLAVTLEHISQKVLKKILDSLHRFSNDLYQQNSKLLILNQDYFEHEQKFIVANYCKHQVQKLQQKLNRLKHKAKNVIQQAPKSSYVHHLRPHKHIPRITKSLVSHQVQEPQDSDDYNMNERQGNYGFLYENVFNSHPNLHPQLKNFLLQKFNSSKSRKINFCKFLYASGQTKLLRQFCRRMDGFLLYDALEFKSYNRIDLYAINLLDSVSSMSSIDQIYYLLDCLVNLVTYYNSIDSKVFKIQIPTLLLKYVSNLKFQEYMNAQNKQSDFRHQIQQNGAECIFSGEFKGSSDQDKPYILDLIKDCLKSIFDKIESKQLNQSLQIRQILTFVVLNIPIDQKLYEKILEINKKTKPKYKSILGKIDNSSSEKLSLIVKQPLSSHQKDGVIIHEIKFINNSDSTQNVQSSEEDYDNYSILMGKRIRAARTIQKLLKKITKVKPPKKQQTIVAKRKRQHNRYEKNWNNILFNIDVQFQSILFKTISQLTADLLYFYMQNTISSSLDLHFMLMTMMRINELKQQLVDFGINTEVEQIGQQQKIENIRIQLNSIRNQIINWKSDEKWLFKNTNLKKKKVFQLKWLSKTHQMKIIKKRHGLKKQAMLSQKKTILKYKK